MTFLPIVQRELRAAARKPSTYRARTIFAVLTTVVSAGLLVFGNFGSSGAAGISIFGTSIFNSLTTLAFIYCLAAGARHSADCLSEEKREGTLGLLFLTDLKGYDVVLGKLASVSTRTVQGLFAFFPILAVTLIMGGITAGEFWRTTAVLINALFFALCFGLWISSITRKAHIALGATLFLLLLLTAVPLASDWVLGNTRWSTAGALRSMSPAAALLAAPDLAYRASPGEFWRALGITHLVGWLFLVGASVALPHAWQDRSVRRGRPIQADDSGPISSSKRPSAALAARHRWRGHLLDTNPIYWLAARNERPRYLLWTLTLAVTVASLVVLLLSRYLAGASFAIFAVLNLGLILVLKLSLAWQASATLAEARRSGAVELLLATPLRIDEILRGHWLALQRTFLWPVVAAVCLTVLPALEAFLRESVSAGNLFLFPLPAMALFSIATLVLDLVALAWVGMWMGLTEPNRMQAFAKTVFWVIVLPAIVFCLPNIVFDLFWIAWARRKLENEFRRAATERFTPPTDWLATPVAPVAPPPIVAR